MARWTRAAFWEYTSKCFKESLPKTPRRTLGVYLQTQQRHTRRPRWKRLPHQYRLSGPPITVYYYTVIPQGSESLVRDFGLYMNNTEHKCLREMKSTSIINFISPKSIKLNLIIKLKCRLLNFSQKYYNFNVI